MKTWKVKVHECPTNFTKPRHLIVEAETKEDAKALVLPTVPYPQDIREIVEYNPPKGRIVSVSS